jgi:hypothetical protein
VQQGTGPAQYGGTSTNLSAGKVSLQGPEGTYTLPTATGGLPNGSIPASGGSFVFTGTGSADVGPFSVTVTLAPLMTWTNSGAAKTVTRSEGLQINWSGGQRSSYIQIMGQSITSTLGVFGMFTCIAPQSAGTFTVPPYVLSDLPVGTGNVQVENPYSSGGNLISVAKVKYQ